MGINTELLYEKITTAKMTNKQFIEKIGMDNATFYRKIKADGVKFTIKEVQKIIEVLKLNQRDAVAIFFAKKVA